MVPFSSLINELKFNLQLIIIHPLIFLKASFKLMKSSFFVNQKESTALICLKSEYLQRMRGMEEIDIFSRGDRPTEHRRSRKEILERRRKRKRQRIIARVIFLLLLFCCAVLIALLVRGIIWMIGREAEPAADVECAEGLEQVTEASETAYMPPWETTEGRPELTEALLTENPYSRPGEALETVDNIFIHYTANPGTTAGQNRSYFESLGQTGETSASAHFIIGLEGEIIQCLPLDEIGYAVKTRNYDSISIECCYTAQNGSFSKETYESLVELTIWLLKVFELEPEAVLRHYDVGGKKCPLYYVENEGAWLEFLTDLTERKNNNENYY